MKNSEIDAYECEGMPPNFYVVIFDPLVWMNYNLMRKFSMFLLQSSGISFFLYYIVVVEDLLVVVEF